MNGRSYFEILDIEECFDIDYSKLEDNYVKISAKIHPDNFDTKEEVFHATQQIFELNNAYRVLKDVVLRGKYILERNRFFLDGERKNITSSKSFLEMVMNISEAIEKTNDKNAIQELLDAKINNSLSDASIYFSNKDFLLAGEELLKAIYLKNIINHSSLL